MALLRDPEGCWILGQGEWPGVPLVPGEVQRVRLRGCCIQKLRDNHLPWKIQEEILLLQQMFLYLENRVCSGSSYDPLFNLN